MIKKLLRTLSRVPGLGWLHGLAGDSEAVDESSASNKAPRRRPREPRGAAPRESAAPAGRQRRSVERAGPAVAQRKAETGVRTAGAGRANAPRRAAGEPVVAAGSQGARSAAGEFRGVSRQRSQAAPLASPGPANRRLGLAAVGPGRAFAFWEVPGQATRRAREYLAERSRGEPATEIILRVHDITGVDFDGSNALRTLDVSIGGSADQDTGGVKGQCYLDLWTGSGDAQAPSRVYCELGVRDSSGDFVALVWSPILDLPVMVESPREAPVRAPVNGEPSAPWAPRLEPRPADSSPRRVAASDASREPARGEPSVAVETEETSGEGDLFAAPLSTGTRPASVPLDLPASARWSFSLPSSADLVRDRLAIESGLSSGLLARRKRS